MNLEAFRALLLPAGQEALAAAMALQPQEADFLRHFTTLQRSFAPELARAALETAVLRREAGAKFPFAEQMYFTRAALEQASSFPVSSYRAKRYRPFERVADLGCSIGGDTLALSRVAHTAGADRDPLRLAMAHANLEALEPGGRTAFVQADLLSPLPFSGEPRLALFFDPARRANGQRIFSVHDYHPPLREISGWLPEHPGLGVKLSPGVRLDELNEWEAEIEFISLYGELKEAVLWFGPLRSARRRATLLPGGHSLDSEQGYSEEGQRRLSLSEPRAYLYEPDPAVLRAGLVEDLGERLEAAQLDPDIAYLTADRYILTPFARAWPVESWFPFQLKRLRAALRERGVGRVTVKKRGSPLQPEALIRDLRLSGSAERTLFLTHLRGRPIVIVCGGTLGRSTD